MLKICGGTALLRFGELGVAKVCDGLVTRWGGSSEAGMIMVQEVDLLKKQRESGRRWRRAK